MSKANRAKKRRALGKQAERVAKIIAATESTGPRVVTQREPEYLGPTPERLAKGDMDMPTGQGAKRKAAMAQDTLAKMLAIGEVTPAEEQAGRAFQQLGYAARRSMGIKGYVSCLSGGVGGHQGDEGAPHAEREWKAVRRALPVAEREGLDLVLDDTAGIAPARYRDLAKKAMAGLIVYWG